MSDNKKTEIPRILFACTLNAIRSPMAEGILQAQLGDQALVQSCGVYGESVDPFGVGALMQWGIDISNHVPTQFEDLPRSLPFLQTIVLSEQAYVAANALSRAFTGPIYFWPMPVPSDVATRNRNARLKGYTDLRDALAHKIVEHFSPSFSLAKLEKAV